MDVGIGLPNTIPGTDGRLVVEWARRADGGPFSTLGVLDRLAYDSIDPFAALAAAAGVTERIGLATMIAIGPLRNAALLAKQAASVDALSGQRLTLGLAVGARLDDYETAQVDHRGRGPRLSEQLAALTRRRRPRRPTQTCRCSSAAWSAPPSRAWRATPTATRTTAARRARSPARRPARSPRGTTSAARDARCSGVRATSRSATRTRAPPTCATTTPSPARSPSRSPPATSPRPARSATSCAATRRPAATS